MSTSSPKTAFAIIFAVTLVAVPSTSASAATWSTVLTQSVGTQSTLAAVDLTSAGDGWAVGSAITTGGLTERWNGQRFSLVSSPNILSTQGASAFGGLSGVDALSATSAFAVGSSAFYGSDGLQHSTAVAERWNGTGWSLMTVPNNPMINSFNDVKAFSASDVWAVGRAGDSLSGASLAMHWNGSTWTKVNTPSPGTRDNTLLGVAGSGPNDVWAVGYYRDLPYGNRARHSLAMHWNGSTWTRVTTPDVGPIQTFLRDVVVLSPTNAWAVGWASGGIDGTTAVVLHWDGRAWSTATAPALGTLNAAAGLTSSNLWTVGSSNPDGAAALADWRGSSWTTQKPALPANAALVGIGVAGTGTVLAVGYTANPTTGAQAPLAVRASDG
jgi:hypothetical protein